MIVPPGYNPHVSSRYPRDDGHLKFSPSHPHVLSEARVAGAGPSGQVTPCDTGKVPGVPHSGVHHLDGQGPEHGTLEVTCVQLYCGDNL